MPFLQTRTVTPYVLRSESNPGRFYTGLTADVPARLEAHNAGRCAHTATARPWRIDVAIEFSEEARAVTFSKRHLRSRRPLAGVGGDSARLGEES